MSNDWGFASIGKNMWQAVRSLCRSPLLFAISVLSVGIGISATITIYSLIDTLLIHDVTATRGDRLVSFWTPWTSYPNLVDLRESKVFQDLAAAGQCYPALHWDTGNQSRDIAAECVSANFFHTIGVLPWRGRPFSMIEATPDRNPYEVVVGYRFWKRKLNADSSALGKTIYLDKLPYTIIGILPPSYRSTEGLGFQPDVFVPLNVKVLPSLLNRSSAVITYLARLAQDQTPAQTTAHLMAAVQVLKDRYPGQLPQVITRANLIPVLGLKKYDEDPDSKIILDFSEILAIVSALVLLIACGNVAGLLLARGVGRQRDLAIRVALGASRAALVRYLLFEAIVISTVGTVAGVLLSCGILKFLANVTIPAYSAQLNTTLNWRFAVATILAGSIATIVSGFLPSFASSRTTLSQVLRTGRGTVSPRLRLRSAMVVLQVAVCAILVYSAFLFLRNLISILHTNPGFNVSHTTWIDIAPDGGTPPLKPQQTQTLLREIQSQPGVQAASWAWYLPFNLVYSDSIVVQAGNFRPNNFHVTLQGIGPDYLSTMQIPLLRGREFTMEDLVTAAHTSLQPILINQSFAQRFFNGKDPIGQHVETKHYGNLSQSVVVGVAANTSFENPGERPKPLIQPLDMSESSFIVRSTSISSSFAPTLERYLRRRLPGFEISHFTVQERFNRSTLPARAAAALTSTLAAIGLLLALMGLAGLSFYNTIRRVPEIGLRMAVGATQRDVIWLMLRESLILVGAGLALGVIGIVAVSNILGTVLSAEMHAFDLPSLLAMTLAVLFATCLSAWLPARRAGNIAPSICLRTD